MVVARWLLPLVAERKIESKLKNILVILEKTYVQLFVDVVKFLRKNCAEMLCNWENEWGN
jgi:hypothetical protein